MGPKKLAKFGGFSMPEGTLLPPEFEYILPQVRRGSALRVLVVILIEYVRPGRDAEPLTYDTIQERSGLKSRQSIVNALQYLMEAGTVRRIPQGRSFVYEPVLRNSLKNRLQRMHESLHDHDSESVVANDMSMNDMHARENAAKALHERCRVAEWVCQDMAIRYDPERILCHIDYAEFVAAHGRLRKDIQSYVVASIKGDRQGKGWRAPVGYSEDWRERGSGTSKEKKKRWFTDDEFETFFEQPGEEGAKGDD